MARHLVKIYQYDFLSPPPRRALTWAIAMEQLHFTSLAFVVLM